MITRLWLYLLLATVLFATLPARAEGSDASAAAKRFDEGLLLFKRKKFVEAADAFHDAYRIHPHGDALFNAGLAWEGAGRRAVAATAYARALEEGITGKGESKARASLAALERHLAKIELTMPPGSTARADVLSLEGERVTLYVDPGSHALIVTLKDGQRLTRLVDAAPGETLTERIETPKPPPPPPKPTPPPKRSKAGPWRTAGWVSLGVAGLATGGAVIFGLNALSARDEFKSSGQTDQGARDRAVRNMHVTNICWGVAAVGAVGSGVLLLYVAPHVDASGPEKTSGLMLHGAF
ncbi:MAG: hypothetical protein IPI67_24910 [Myxococcales bacterium]|nr:hypothetical protein [Myxococcales bacterium]